MDYEAGWLMTISETPEALPERDGHRGRGRPWAGAVMAIGVMVGVNRDDDGDRRRGRCRRASMMASLVIRGSA
jgi:hypothetical protein